MLTARQNRFVYSLTVAEGGKKERLAQFVIMIVKGSMEVGRF